MATQTFERFTGLEEVTDAIRKLTFKSVILWTAYPHRGRPFHWRTTFEFTNPRVARALSLDMASYIGEDQGSKAVMDVNGRCYGELSISVRSGNMQIMSRNVARQEETAFMKSVTAGDLINLITRNELQYFKFHKDHSGCLHWQLNLLKLMGDQGWIKGNFAEKTEEALYEFRNKLDDPKQLPLPPVKGEFTKN